MSKLNVKELTVSFGFTKNLGNFNSARHDASITVSVDPSKDDLEEVYTKCWETCKDQVRKQVKQISGDKND